MGRANCVVRSIKDVLKKNSDIVVLLGGMGWVLYWVKKTYWLLATIMDAAIYKWIAERMMSGALLYVDVWDHKPPGIFIIFCINTAISGSGVTTLHVLHAIMVLGGVVSLYLLLQQVFAVSKKIAFVGAFLYGFITVLFFEGPVINAEHFFTNLILIGFWFYTRSFTFPPQAKKLSILYIIFAALTWSFAGFIKYHALIEILFLSTVYAFVVTRSYKKTIQTLLPILLALILPYGITLLYYVSHHALSDLYFALLGSNWHYVIITNGDAYRSADGLLSLLFMGYKIAFAVSLLYLFYKKDTFTFAIAWVLCTAILTTLGNRPYAHYILQAVAPTVVLAGILLTKIYYYKLLFAVRYTIVAVTIIVCCVFLLLFGRTDYLVIQLNKNYPYNHLVFSLLQQFVPSQGCTTQLVWPYTSSTDMSRAKYFLAQEYISLGQEVTDQYWRQQNTQYVIADTKFLQDFSFTINAKIVATKEQFTIYELGYCK